MKHLVLALVLAGVSGVAVAQQQYHLDIDGTWYAGADMTRVVYFPDIQGLDSYVDGEICKRPDGSFPQFAQMSVVVGTGMVVDLVFGDEILYFLPKAGAPAFFSIRTPTGNVACSRQVTPPSSSVTRLQIFRSGGSTPGGGLFRNGFER